MSPPFRCHLALLAAVAGSPALTGCRATPDQPPGPADRTADRRTIYDATVLPSVEDPPQASEGRTRVPPTPGASRRRAPGRFPAPAPPAEPGSARTPERFPVESGGELMPVPDRDKPFVKRIGRRVREWFEGEESSPPDDRPPVSEEPRRSRRKRNMPPPAPPVSWRELDAGIQPASAIRFQRRPLPADDAPVRLEGIEFWEESEPRSSPSTPPWETKLEPVRQRSAGERPIEDWPFPVTDRAARRVRAATFFDPDAPPVVVIPRRGPGETGPRPRRPSLKQPCEARPPPRPPEATTTKARPRGKASPATGKLRRSEVV